MTDNLITDLPDIEHWPTWTTDLFLCTNPYHEMLKEPVLKAITAHRDQADQTIASQVAVTAKHALFESELDFLESDDADLQTLRQVLTDLVLECAASVNEPYWPEDAEPEAQILKAGITSPAMAATTMRTHTRTVPGAVFIVWMPASQICRPATA